MTGRRLGLILPNYGPVFDPEHWPWPPSSGAAAPTAAATPTAVAEIWPLVPR